MVDSNNSTVQTAVRRKALIVDDYILIRRNHKLLLEKLGFEVLEASNGQEAIDLINARGPDSIAIIIADLMMPVMGGADFVSELHKVFGLKLPPVLICSCVSDINEIRKVITTGISGYVVKPVDYKAFIKKLQDIFPDLEKSGKG